MTETICSLCCELVGTIHETLMVKYEWGRFDSGVVVLSCEAMQYYDYIVCYVEKAYTFFEGGDLWC